MTGIDSTGNIHGRDGRFAGHVSSEAPTVSLRGSRAVQDEHYIAVHEIDHLGGRFATLAYCDAGEPYSWDEFHVLRGGDGALYVASDSGCSCYGFGHGGSFRLRRVATWQEAVRAAQEWTRSDGETAQVARTGQVHTLTDRLTDLRPRGFMQPPAEARLTATRTDRDPEPDGFSSADSLMPIFRQP